MLNHNKRHPAIRGHVPEKSIERLQPARRRSYANNKRCSLFSSRPVFRRTRRLFSPETFFSPTCLPCHLLAFISFACYAIRSLSPVDYRPRIACLCIPSPLDKQKGFPSPRPPSVARQMNVPNSHIFPTILLFLYLR